MWCVSMSGIVLARIILNFTRELLVPSWCCALFCLSFFVHMLCGSCTEVTVTTSVIIHEFNMLFRSNFLMILSRFCFYRLWFMRVWSSEISKNSGGFWWRFQWDEDTGFKYGDSRLSLGYTPKLGWTCRPKARFRAPKREYILDVIWINKKKKIGLDHRLNCFFDRWSLFLLNKTRYQQFRLLSRPKFFFCPLENDLYACTRPSYAKKKSK